MLIDAAVLFRRENMLTNGQEVIVGVDQLKGKHRLK
jgi:hypothetical protein